MSTRLRPAVFLDRDGVLIEEIGYLKHLDDLAFLPGALQAVKRLNEAGWPVVIVTNQSGVARGYFDEHFVQRVHATMAQQLAEVGAWIDRFEYSPFHPTEGVGVYRSDSDCRKPKPGMLLRAAGALGLDLPRSWLVGDRPGDIQAGTAAGCRCILVQTGYGSQVESSTVANALIVPGLVDAVDHILCADTVRNFRSHSPE